MTTTMITTMGTTTTMGINAHGTFPMSAIGIVHNELAAGVSPPRAKSSHSLIELRPELADGLTGVEPGQALVIIFAFHQSADDLRLLQHPQGDRSRPHKGVFALRSPHRPNPIGMTAVWVKEVGAHHLVVDGLDAFDGTPVLDIKPYVPWLDQPPEL